MGRTSVLAISYKGIFLRPQCSSASAAAKCSFSTIAASRVEIGIVFCGSTMAEASKFSLNGSREISLFEHFVDKQPQEVPQLPPEARHSHLVVLQRDFLLQEQQVLDVFFAAAEISSGVVSSSLASAST